VDSGVRNLGEELMSVVNSFLVWVATFCIDVRENEKEEKDIVIEN
jgi:hypothetical protein